MGAQFSCTPPRAARHTRLSVRVGDAAHWQTLLRAESGAQDRRHSGVLFDQLANLVNTLRRTDGPVRKVVDLGDVVRAAASLLVNGHCPSLCLGCRGDGEEIRTGVVIAVVACATPNREATPTYSVACFEM